MNSIKQLFENKIVRLFVNIVRVILVILILAFVLTVYLQRFSDNKISFFNYRMFTVVSSSMDPKYKIGDVLFSKSVDYSTIKVGDSISYRGEKGDVKDKIVTHQVVKIVKNEKGEYEFHTKGIASLIEDPIVNSNQVYGKIVYKSIILSFVYRVIESNIGFYLCIIIPIMGIIGYEIIIILLDKEDKKRSRA